MKYEINDKYAKVSEVQSFVKHLPTTFEAEGEQLFANGRNVLRVFAVKEGHPILSKVVVKRFRARNLFQTLAYSTFFSSKAKRAFRNGMTLTQHGFDTPEPIAYAEERHHGLLRYCYYLTAFTDAPSVRTELDVNFNRPMAKCFAHFIAHLHQQGFVHHDLNFDNVLYREVSQNHYEISVIDINRLTIGTPSQLTLKDCKDDFVRWTDRKDLLTYVTKEYAKERGLDIAETLNEVLHLKAIHDRNWHRRKNFTLFRATDNRQRTTVNLKLYKRNSKPHHS